MKQILQRAIFVALATAIGIAIVMLIDDKGFDFFRFIITLLVAFIVDFIALLIPRRKKL